MSSVLSRAGVEESAHVLRHTVATRPARQRGRDRALVAGILGRADLMIARHYVRSDLENRRGPRRLAEQLRGCVDAQPLR